MSWTRKTYSRDKSHHQSSQLSPPRHKFADRPASSSNPTNTSPQNKLAGNRRKSGHHRILNSDDISFESVILEGHEDVRPEQVAHENEPEDAEEEGSAGRTSSSSSSSPPADESASIDDDKQDETPLLLLAKKRKIDGSLPDIKEFLAEADGNGESVNPNLALAKKVAFLRVSVNYLMLNLGRSPFDFNRPRALAELIGEYNMKNRMAGQRKD